jgi:hypothetical protein
MDKLRNPPQLDDPRNDGHGHQDRDQCDSHAPAPSANPPPHGRVLTREIGTTLRTTGPHPLGDRMPAVAAQPFPKHHRPRPPPEGHDHDRSEPDHGENVDERLHRIRHRLLVPQVIAQSRPRCTARAPYALLHDGPAFRTAREPGERVTAGAACAAARTK